MEQCGIICNTISVIVKTIGGLARGVDGPYGGIGVSPREPKVAPRLRCRRTCVTIGDVVTVTALGVTGKSMEVGLRDR